MRPLTVTLIAILAATLFGSWFIATHERVTREEYVGYRGEARVNPYLAAELLLRQLEIESDSRAALVPSEWLPDTTDTLITRVFDNITVESEGDLLLEWASSGGHLILLPPPEDSSLTNSFLDSVGFEFVDVDREDDESNSAGEDVEQTVSYRVDLENTPRRIVAQNPETISAKLSDPLGIVAARMAWGDGFISIFATDRYFANNDIAESDHARLLADAVSGYIEPGTVWFVYNAAFPSLWSVIWDAAPYVVVSLSLALVLWLWSIAPRFGPKVASPSLDRRSIVEHITAAGRFVWKNHGAQALNESSIAALLQETEARHPGIGRLPLERQAQLIAKMTGLKPRHIAEALSEPGTPTHREFVHTMRTLQRIRNRL